VGGRFDSGDRGWSSQHVGPVGQRRAERGQHPLGRVQNVTQLGQRGPALGQPVRVLVRALAGGLQIGVAAPGRVAHRGQGRGQRVVQQVDPPGRRPVEHPGHRGPGLPERGHHGLLDHAPAPPRGDLDGGRGQLVGAHRGDPVHQVMRLVDDHHVVLGQRREVLHRVDGQQRVVGDHDVGLPGLVPGLLGEALLAERAALCPGALPGADRYLPPGRLGHAGHQLVPVAGQRRGRPLVQPLDLPPGGRHRARVEQHLARLLRRAAGQPLVAQVVPAALEDGEHRFPPQQRLQRGGQPRQVPVDQLALERDRRGGHHHGGLLGDRVPGRGHQVGQRLPGPGAGLHGQVLARRERPLDRLGHRHLPGALGPAGPGHCRGEQVRRARRPVLARGSARGASGLDRALGGGAGRRPDVIAAYRRSGPAKHPVSASRPLPDSCRRTIVNAETII
jgi:hypothetical protein